MLDCGALVRAAVSCLQYGTSSSHFHLPVPEHDSSEPATQASVPCSRQCRSRHSHDPALQDFDTIWHSLLTMVGVMLGGPDLKTFYGSHNAGVCIALLLVYVFAMSLVLLNCLIGIMANACSRVGCQPLPVQALLLAAAKPAGDASASAGAGADGQRLASSLLGQAAPTMQHQLCSPCG